MRHRTDRVPCLPGGTVESQKEFIESLSNIELRRNFDRQNKIPPVANKFALGYTYYDLLDADHEGKLALMHPHEGRFF